MFTMANKNAFGAPPFNRNNVFSHFILQFLLQMDKQKTKTAKKEVATDEEETKSLVNSETNV